MCLLSEARPGTILLRKAMLWIYYNAPEGCEIDWITHKGWTAQAADL